MRGEKKMQLRYTLKAGPHLHLLMTSTDTALLNLLLQMKMSTNRTSYTFFFIPQDSGVIEEGTGRYR